MLYLNLRFRNENRNIITQSAIFKFSKYKKFDIYGKENIYNTQTTREVRKFKLRNQNPAIC